MVNEREIRKEFINKIKLFMADFPDITYDKNMFQLGIGGLWSGDKPCCLYNLHHIYLSDDKIMMECDLVDDNDMKLKNVVKHHTISHMYYDFDCGVLKNLYIYIIKQNKKKIEINEFVFKQIHLFFM